MTTTLEAKADDHVQPTNDPSNWLQRLNLRLRQFTQPAARLTDPEERRKARLLAYMALALAIILTIAGIISTFTSIFFPDPAISLGVPGTSLIFLTALGFWVSYRYSITVRYRSAAWITIWIIYFFLTGFMFFYPGISFGLPLVLRCPCYWRRFFSPRLAPFACLASLLSSAL